jgi:DmsE family decaheme c-type cytochrome
VKHLSLGAFAAVALAVLAAGVATAQAQAPPASPAPAKVEAGPACADCHDEAKIFAGNPHTRAYGAAHKGAASNEVCATCHGDGTKHMEAGGDKTLIRTLHGRTGAETCATCHKQSAERSSFKTGVHAPSEAVNCLSCHAIHKSNPKQANLLVSEPTQLCATCHQDAASSFRTLPYAHRLKEGALSCVSCHDPHGRSARHAVKETRAGEPGCVSCHAEVRGPFVYPHVNGVAGDCTSCHIPHGSSYPHQLQRATIASQCLECHSTLGVGTLGSQPPSFHNISLPRYRNCTTCHVAVHGSQRSPQLLK